ncbi:hypothetical protein FGO68_gene15844 [Halteria grandinella]|uniref:Uncharacterized protein n=1 Tax=Halteria grandinella TaxID=5974 RepID=A0A8J8N9V4_HALGN|nr:hypothetical protein FGO68_gene15844 [Halteria grandinella]
MHPNDTGSFASIQQAWNPMPTIHNPNEKTTHSTMKISQTPSGFKLTGIGLDSLKKQTQQNITAFGLKNNQTLKIHNDIGTDIPPHRIVVGSMSQMSNARIGKGNVIMVNQAIAM